MHAKYREDFLTHTKYNLELWLEAVSTSEPDKN